MPLPDWLAKRLCAGDPVAAVDLDRLAAGVGVVAAAGRDEQDALVGDPAQGGLGAGQPAAVAPGGERDDVLVHRARQRGRAAVVGELALQRGQLGDGGAVAAELGGHGRLQQAGVAERVVRLGDEAAVGVVPGGVLGERRPDGGGALGEVGRSLRSSAWLEPVR